jgi:predicted RNase H-like HicB family nuclease
MRQVIIYPGEDGYWVAKCPSLPGCISQGRTKEEAIQNIREAIVNDVIEHLRNKGLPAAYHLALWSKNCDRFEGFVVCYHNKIIKKIKGAKTKEDSSDVFAELFVSYLLLLDKRIEVEYEKRSVKSRGPDLSVIFDQSIQFNVEVARVRRAETDARFDGCLAQLNRRVNAGPSNLEFRIRLEILAISEPMLQRLEQSIEEVAQFIEDTIETEESNLLSDTEHYYPIPGFEDALTLVLFKHPFESEPGETAFSFLSPIAYTQKEHYKFGDIIVNKLGQLIPRMINVIFIISDSNTHEPEDLAKGIRSFFRALNQGDEGVTKKVLKVFDSIEDFNAQMEKLSGIVFRSKWKEHTDPNVLWCNSQASDPIPEAMKVFFRRASHPPA